MRLQEFLYEGGWASTLTQGTHITPALVAKVMNVLTTHFIPQLNKFLTTKGLGVVEISSPGGSATYYKRDLEQDPTREYGDIDVQFHIPRIPSTTDNENETIYKKAIIEFCDTTKNYSSENGTNVILKTDTGYVQVDLIMSYYENKNWTNALKPEYRLKGVLCNSLYSSLGEALNLSFGGGRGVQAKLQKGSLVPFKTLKDTQLHTVTNNPETWALDIAKFLGATKFSNTLVAYPGLIDNEVRVADIIKSFKGIAESLEMSGKLGQYQSAEDLLHKIRDIYLGKIQKGIESSKFAKAGSPEAIKKAEDTKKMLAVKSAEIAKLFENKIVVETKVKKYSFEILQLNKAMSLLNKYCTEAIPLIPHPIWRGMANHDQDIIFIDTPTGIRKSTNTTNHYTELIDNSPYFKGWPKRSRSLICSTDINYARDFSDWDGEVYAIFPFNGAKIAVCPKDDIWGTPIRLPLIDREFSGGGSWMDQNLSDFNFWLRRSLRFPDNYAGMIKQTKTPAFAKLVQKKWPGVNPEQIIPMIQKALSPEQAGFRLLTIPEFVAAQPKKKELWIGSKVIAINQTLWKKFRSAYKASKK